MTYEQIYIAVVQNGSLQSELGKLYKNIYDGNKMGVVCCNKVTSENQCGELTFKGEADGKGLLSELLAKKPFSGLAKLGRCKTLARKENKKFVMPKTASDAVLIMPSQFVLENPGILSESYQFVKQMGQGTIAELKVGSYGTVYLAVHKKTKERRAIKMINRSVVAKEKEGELFGEIKVLKEMVATISDPC